MLSIHPPTTGRQRRTGYGLAWRATRLAVGAALVLGAAWAGPAWAQSAPAVTPQQIWHEDFAITTGKAVGIENYKNPTTGDTYKPGTGWGSGDGKCNGWVLSSSFGSPASGDGGCDTKGGVIIGKGTINSPSAWNFLQGMAYVLNQYNGDNYAVASMTNGGAQNAGVQLATGTASITTIGTTGVSGGTFTPVQLQPGHYYVVSADFAEVHCTNDPGAGAHPLWRNASETLTVVTNAGNAYRFTTDPCSFPVRASPTVGQIHVGTAYSGVIQAGTNDYQVTGFQIYNSTATYNANDVAFNNLQILDVTPYLYKSFNPADPYDSVDYTVVPDPVTGLANGRLTFTIVNTTDYMIKNGWSFTDKLPPGLTATPGIYPLSGAGCSGTATVSADGTTVQVSGNMAAGNANGVCSVTLDVSAANGTYTNKPPDNVTDLIGLEPPPPASLSVGDLLLTKVATVYAQPGNAEVPAVLKAGDKIQYVFTVTNQGAGTITNVTVVDSPFTGQNGTPAKPDPSACNTNTLAGGASTECTAYYTVSAKDVEAGSITNTATATGLDVNNHLLQSVSTVSTPVATLTLKKEAAVSQFAAGQEAVFTFEVKNTGTEDLTGVTINETAFTGSGVLSAYDCSSGAYPFDLLVNATETCTATYTLTAADVAAGSISNTAVATADGVRDRGVPTRVQDGIISNPSSALLRGSGGGGGITQVPALDARALALLALLLGGLAWFAQRKTRR